MNRTPPIDFHTVDPQHNEVHARCLDWSRWVKPTVGGIAKSSLFNGYRSKNWQWERPTVHIAVNELQALETERAVSTLPNNEREAIRWAYNLRRGSPGSMARRLAVDKSGLLELIRSGRCLLVARLRV